MQHYDWLIPLNVVVSQNPDSLERQLHPFQSPGLLNHASGKQLLLVLSSADNVSLWYNREQALMETFSLTAFSLQYSWAETQNQQWWACMCHVDHAWLEPGSPRVKHHQQFMKCSK